VRISQPLFSYISGPWNFICKMVHGAPLVLGLGSFSLFLFSSFDFEHHCIDLTFSCSEFWILWIFFMPPSFVWAPSMIENFPLCPPVLFGHFQSLRIVLALAPSVGCDPSQGYFFKKNLLGSKEDCKGYISAL